MSHRYRHRGLRMTGLVVSLSLCGCAVSPMTRFFTLVPTQPASHTVQSSSCSGSTVVLGPTMLPEYLVRSQLVSRESDVQLKVDEFSRWGAMLPEEFRQALASMIGTRLGTAITSVYPLQDRYDMDWRVSMDMQRFDGTEGGTVYLAAQWSLWRLGKMRELTRHSQFQSDSGPGKEAYVATLRSLLEKLADEITVVLTPLCGSSGANRPVQK